MKSLAILTRLADPILWEGNVFTELIDRVNWFRASASSMYNREVLLDRPTVMISSTIGELGDLRLAVKRLVDDASVANAWLFEIHALASGSAPEEQYLNLARACDLYVLIVGSQQSDPTETEYEIAYIDNPEKILTFFVGDGSDDVRRFRELLESRHTWVKRENANDLVGPIAKAVIGAVQTGGILRSGLIRRLDERIDSARSLVADVSAILEPRVVADGSVSMARDYFRRDGRTALFGIGGCGKTLCAALAARRHAQDGSLLPIYATCRSGVIRVLGSASCSVSREIPGRYLSQFDFRLML